MSVTTTDVSENDTFENETFETVRYGLGVQRWALLVVAFVLGVVSVYTINKASSVLEMGPTSAIAAPVENDGP